MIGASKWIVSTLLTLLVLILGGIGGMYVRLGSVEKTLAVTAGVSRRNAELIRDLKAEIQERNRQTGEPPYRVR